MRLARVRLIQHERDVRLLVERLRERRQDLKMPVRTLAPLLGCDPTTLYNWERHKGRPRPEVLLLWGEVLGFRVELRMTLVSLHAAPAAPE